MIIFRGSIEYRLDQNNAYYNLITFYKHEANA